MFSSETMWKVFSYFYNQQTISDVHMHHCGHMLCSSYSELSLDAVACGYQEDLTGILMMMCCSQQELEFSRFHDSRPQEEATLGQ